MDRGFRFRWLTVSGTCCMIERHVRGVSRVTSECPPSPDSDAY